MKTETTDGEPRHVALFQLKTIPMAGSSTFERDHLVLGSKRYYLHNRDSDYIRLIALICSEAVHLPIDDETALQFQQHPTVMIHSQLVDNARHEDMRRYRADLYTSTCSANLEVISLNWAREPAGTPINGTTRGHSCIFMKSEHFVRADEKLERNHAQGMYYSNWKKYHTDISAFNYDEHVFHFENCRPALIGAAVQLRRTGPEMRSVFRWDEHSMAWQQCAKADDGFTGLCDAYHDPSLRLCTEGLSSPVHAERLLALSSGKLLPVPNWHDVRNLPSFEAEADERTKRLTFVHEQDAASNEFRNICLTRYIRLVSEVLGKPSSYPVCIADLSGSFRVVAPQIGNGFRQNIESTSPGSAGATAVFLGAQADGDANGILRPPPISLGAGRGSPSARVFAAPGCLVRMSGGLQSLYQPLATITDDAEVLPQYCGARTHEPTPYHRDNTSWPQQRNNASSESIIRAERHHRASGVAVYYFDFSERPKEVEFNLTEYLQKYVASDYYLHQGSLQWNYYLYFLLEKDAIARLREKLESSRDRE